jgi:peroxiredoxin Q/BCP
MRFFVERTKMGKEFGVGDKIPDFTLPDERNEAVRISSQDNKKRIIYFYPKDDTTVCTAQACSFRDWQSELTALGYEVIGISSDSSLAHLQFIAKYDLNFTLLSDTGGKVRKQFGAASFIGLIPSRKTFLISEAGIVEYVYNAMFEGEGHIEAMKIFITNKNQPL